MVLSQREKLIAIVLGIAVGLLVLDQVVISPMLAWQSDLSAARDKVRKDQNENKALFHRQANYASIYSDMKANGLKSDAADATVQMSAALFQWAQDAGLKLTEVTPAPPVPHHGYVQTVFRITGTGTTKTVAQMLWRIETAAIPVRMVDITLSSNPEGTDQLKVTMRLSTLSETPGAAPSGSNRGARPMALAQ